MWHKRSQNVSCLYALWLFYLSHFNLFFGATRTKVLCISKETLPNEKSSMKKNFTEKYKKLVYANVNHKVEWIKSIVCVWKYTRCLILISKKLMYKNCNNIEHNVFWSFK